MRRVRPRPRAFLYRLEVLTDLRAEVTKRIQIHDRRDLSMSDNVHYIQISYDSVALWSQIGISRSCWLQL